LNGQTVLFVARIPGLAEEANGWQAFFVSFLKFFLNGFGNADVADKADLSMEVWRTPILVFAGARRISTPTARP